MLHVHPNTLRHRLRRFEEATGRDAARPAPPRRAVVGARAPPAGGLTGLPVLESVITTRRTKILATLGPATDPPGVLDRLVAAGWTARA